MSVLSVPGQSLPITVPSLLLVSAAMLGTIAVGLLVPALERSEAARAEAPPPIVEPPAAVTPPPALSASAALVVEPAPLARATATAEASPPKPEACPAIRVAFDTGQAAPSAHVAARLRALAVALAPHPEATVVIDGHADSLGSDELNLRLSKRRAEALAWVLQSSGIDAKRVTSRGFGAFSPVEGSTEDADINRRAVIHVRGACPPGFTEVLGP
jgi:outer membrane protein OmpA-like peptidoglycan-associated protein